MLVTELNREQLDELKESLATLEHDNNGENISVGELLESHNEISDQEVFEYFAGVIFSEEDFCS